MISLEKLMVFTHLQKLPKNVGDLGKLMVAQSAKNRPIWSHCSLHTNNNVFLFLVKSSLSRLETSGQSYKHFMLINYDPRGIPDLKIPHITTLRS